MISVIVNGAQGKMGRVASAALLADPRFSLLAQLGREDDLAAHLQQHQPAVVVDLTLPDCVFANASTIIAAGARPVIGTSGLTAEQIDSLTTLAAERQCGGIIAPNFSIAALLMMRFAQQAAKWFPEVDIVELHHQQKVDTPSATAIKTAQMIKSSCATAKVNIDSVRLPSIFAHQAVILQGEAETLTLKHDAEDRSCMMPGLLRCCEFVMQVDRLYYGLEHALEFDA
jgi:4-hydroxy-tetrahydrodipicolinate reductase